MLIKVGGKGRTHMAGLAEAERWYGLALPAWVVAASPRWQILLSRVS